MSNLRALVVGAGFMGKNHARVLNSLDNVDLIAIADPKFERAASEAKIYKIRAYRTLEQALKDQSIDFVCIAAPTILHSQLAKISLKAKVATFIEKPIY